MFGYFVLLRKSHSISLMLYTTAYTNDSLIPFSPYSTIEIYVSMSLYDLSFHRDGTHFMFVGQIYAVGIIVNKLQ